MFVALFCGCKKEIFEQKGEDFTVNSFIKNIKSYQVIADYSHDPLPVNMSSTEKPIVLIQPRVIKGKDILVSVIVPASATDIYFGAANSEEDYAGLHFEGQPQSSALGYYQLPLVQINNPETEANGIRNYMVVLSSDEKIQLNKFDLIVSYSTPAGTSNQQAVPVDVVSIAPYQQRLMVGFQPLRDYSYTLSISLPDGSSVSFSYNKNTAAENFDNSQSPASTLSHDSQLDINWIELDPILGRYMVKTDITIEIQGGSQTVVFLLIIYAEGVINQITPSVDIDYNGGPIAVGKIEVGFNYFSGLANWFDWLPDCPCFYYDAQELGAMPTMARPDDPPGKWSDCGEANQDFHYGACYEIRWLPSESGRPGQQCTYTISGDLITGGIAAGSPDKYSPRSCGFNLPTIPDFFGHKTADIDPWESLPCSAYLENWPANSDLNCFFGRPVTGINHMSKMIGAMTCKEATLLIKSADESTSIDADLQKYVLGESVQLDAATLINRLQDWKANTNCFFSPTLCGVIDQAIINLQ